MRTTVDSFVVTDLYLLCNIYKLNRVNCYAVSDKLFRAILAYI